MQQSIWKKICAKISWNGPVNDSMCGKGWLNYNLRNCWFESEWGHDVIVGSIRNHTTFLINCWTHLHECFAKSIKINPKLNEKSRKKKLLSYQEPIFVCVSLSIWLVFIYFYCLLDNNNFLGFCIIFPSFWTEFTKNCLALCQSDSIILYILLSVLH